MADDQQRNAGVEAARELTGKLQAESNSDLQREDPITVAQRIYSVVEPALRNALGSYNDAVPEAAEMKLHASDRLLRLTSVSEPKLGIVFHGPEIALLPPNTTVPVETFHAETEYPAWTFSGGKKLDDVVKEILVRANELSSNA